MDKKWPLQGAQSFIITGGKQNEEDRTFPGIHPCSHEKSQTVIKADISALFRATVSFPHTREI
jgi:hypothetical protein